eukprot:CAMPEP_0195063230 /NCGR_PEP_ID=MMETSP0448-20130528/9646_1 /TAXON_ID=66468 /ORGANISM="Heterocapsa triquestra, Strain CCMP 448" /LENGTH=37 /DNA_ID= /DNA_START= /DNA_END= /DNA_ORIENTATION=
MGDDMDFVIPLILPCSLKYGIVLYPRWGCIDCDMAST